MRIRLGILAPLHHPQNSVNRMLLAHRFAEMWVGWQSPVFQQTVSTHLNTKQAEKHILIVIITQYGTGRLNTKTKVIYNPLYSIVCLQNISNLYSAMHCSFDDNITLWSRKKAPSYPKVKISTTAIHARGKRSNLIYFWLW